MGMVLGLTGSIASGKSTVSKMISEIGIPIVDADVIAKQVVEVGQVAYQNIIDTFGTEILLENGEINRPALGAIIFHDPGRREELNKIVHPEVRKVMLQQSKALLDEGHRIVILDIPLLFESKLTSLVEKTIVVYVDEENQIKRLMERNKLSEEEAMARIKSQIPVSEKVKLADYVIDNNGTIEHTNKQVITLMTKIIGNK
ncbi:dephospho-CoA kinase [Bacillus sp. RG28]|uniref:Dephospho-CoA kinase n=1 Tax=Gottfriedia endophytica TaxID=2820819 RepID=A0A940NHB2_9BACI|nr:dephospho-CoA kinase [Gottfriedia endophytica]MBP0724032.1 dephospho-CoA kinase [Gottfriedia endophytica]